MTKRYLTFVLTVLAGATLFYLAYLFILQFSSPNFKLILSEPNPTILMLEIIVIMTVGIFCFVKAFIDLKD